MIRPSEYTWGITQGGDLQSTTQIKLLVAALASILVVSGLIATFLYYHQAMVLFWSEIIFMISLVSGVGVLLYTNRLLLASHVAIGLSVIEILICTAGSGLLYSPLLVWIILAPIAAIFFTNRKGAVFWIVCTLIALAVILFLHKNHIFVPWQIVLNHNQTAYYGVFSTFIVILAAGTWFYIIRRAMVMSFSEVERARTQISTLIRILGYDINGPITNIKNHTALLESGHIGTDKIVRTALHIQDSTEHLSNLISKVRDINAIESGKTEIKLTSLNVSNFIEATISQMQERLEIKNIKILYQKSGDNFNARISEEFFPKVLFHIIENAIKFSDTDSNIQIDLLASPSDLRLFIKDTGIGIPEAILKNIYSYDADRIRLGTHQEQGEGLGLPLVYRLLQRMNASIEITSNAIEETATKNGTTVLITLPK